ncbi:MAG: 5-oxoprolinase subunit PxpA [Thiobacillus sp.]
MIELNADIGEGCDDAGLMPYVDRVSIASGGHAGDATSMTVALRLAKAHGVAVGGHPGYPDRAGFGRYPLAATAGTIRSWVVGQLEALAELARREGMALAHVKPHGALYNAAAEDAEVAAAVAEAVRAVDPGLLLVGLAGSRLIEAGQAAGLQVLNEAFADRRYATCRRLVSRETPGAVIHDPRQAAEQALSLARGAGVLAVTGERLAVRADTLCLHGDTPGAIKLARAVHAALHGG